MVQLMVYIFYVNIFPIHIPFFCQHLSIAQNLQAKMIRFCMDQFHKSLIYFCRHVDVPFFKIFNKYPRNIKIYISESFNLFVVFFRNQQRLYVQHEQTQALFDHFLLL